MTLPIMVLLLLRRLRLSCNDEVHRSGSGQTSLQQYRREGDCSITGFLGDTAVAAMVRSDWDPEHWPELKKGESTFVHKLGVPPAYQSRGVALEMLEYAVTISQARGISHTRLDCAADRSKLCGVYESAGYVKVAERVVGAYPIAFFARALGARLFLSDTEG
jgi:ribosomal protein S18 acetylase RimI-like enzyme